MAFVLRPGIGWAVANGAAVSLASAHSKGKWAFGLPIASIPLSPKTLLSLPQTNRCPKDGEPYRMMKERMGRSTADARLCVKTSLVLF